MNKSINTKILVLGSTGMLGSTVYRYLRETISLHTVHGTLRSKNALKDKTLHYFDAQQFLHDPKKYPFLQSFNYIINCIGIIKPHCQDTDLIGIKNAIEVNALFPYKLVDFCKNSRTKILQIATDCVYSGLQGHYKEDAVHDAFDVYGKTKSLGEVNADNIIHIRCSIIGTEQKTSYSLLEWFLHQPSGSTLTGYTHHKWNGVTTLQFAKLCQKIIQDKIFNDLRKTSHVYHFVPNSAVTKYELLQLFKKIFNKKIEIKAVSDSTKSIDRTLATIYPSFTSIYGYTTMTQALQELQSYEKI